MARCRILEIGDRALLAREHAGSTSLAWTGHARALPPGLASTTFESRSSIAAAVRGGTYDAIVWHVPEFDPWRLPRAGLGQPQAWRAWALARELATSPTPWIVVDTRDRATMTRGVATMLARAATYFLRECPLDLDPWLGAANLRHGGKVTPISIGLSRERLAELPATPIEKSLDVFFAGQRDTPLRRAEWPVLRDLARTGVRIEIADAPLPRAEFYRRCAAAWIVWSPEGRGWQCFRHFEAAASGSVPLMNRPAIRQHEPLVDGVHALHYDPAPGALAAAIARALADKPRLARIAAAGRAQVLRHHTHEATCDRILAAVYASMPK